MNADQQEQLLAFCRAKNIMLLADEVYHRLIYDADVAPSFLSIAREDDPLIVVNGFSKSWAMTGWRLGWMVVPASRLESFMVMAQCFTTGSPTFVQAGGIAALQDGEPLVHQLREQYRAGRELVMQRLGAHPKIEIVRPEGAFYAFPRILGLTDSMDFAQTLIEQDKVGVVPGYTFGAGFESHIRLCFAQSPTRLSEALDRLLRHVDHL
jgi:aspartate/methionine/tyrosine aminotransferase